MERRSVERVRGTQDSWPPEARPLAAVRARLEESFESFGYARIDVPVLEPAELHLRKSGLEIISKLYSFEDQGGRRLCLRPELTASVVRAYIAHPPARLPARLYSAGPVFRYERPARGRYRQFTQSGVELIGAHGSLADAEAISLATHALDRLGLRRYQITVGHVGILADLLARLGLGGRLRSFLLESVEEAKRRGISAVRARLEELDPELFERAAPGAAAISPESGSTDGASSNARDTVGALLGLLGGDALGRRRPEDVVARMTRKLAGDSQAQAAERALAFIERLRTLRGAPAEIMERGRTLLSEYGLSEEPLEALAATLRYLEDFGLETSRLVLDLGLSRGLQYYTGMVFEIDHAGLGAESQLCGGGRYDDLVRALGARQSAPALGFAFGVERVALALEAEGAAAAAPSASETLVIPAAPEHAGAAGRIAQVLRGKGLRVHLDVSARPLRAALTYAGREGFAVAAVVGAEVAATDSVRLRVMATGQDETVPLALAVERIAEATVRSMVPAAPPAAVEVSSGR